ncbi:hypothetical protein ACFW3Z_10540 [Nocardiopsis alba]|uniref:DUF5709 domain-containing protein n=2 Tax=Nocardiopsis alba TaxID=53437 RepID=A0A7K2ILN4_9ACTN|nr:MULTISPECIES: hypothetical protein [Nocardiopsis]AFR11159.1 hypothetical protein B005_5327 [Nocardiopsis alba ATCC BAA-2165]MEC3895742.1 hypothetical protein [Nocardiopsis sp. LDBS1602]MYR30901.1 hypothetical protein [Nocardiopsis alba]
MSEQPYDVDSDMGEDPQESEIAEAESRQNPGEGVYGYTFEDEQKDDEGELGIEEEVRLERDDVLPREDFDIDEPGAEEEAVHEVDDSDT